ncbi:peptidoglycan-recognition protein SC2-like [Haliotis rubra]|uniref:peptidoglycan-recognition protein SC2-like n=1 Tax=Haliotis rubra TaxID=36100 RepID=UPI001EE5A97A|nr:peptidoglycan-recognition protein SC2-like [Haliotis rubra]
MMLLSLVTVGFLATTLRGASAAQCACATGDVHVRSGVGTSHAILGVLTKGSCATYEGDQNSGWMHVNFNGKSGWIAGNYVNIQSCSGGSTGGTSTHAGCPHIVTRAQWGARAPHSVSHLSGAVKYAFIHHGESGTCSSQSSCSAIVRSYQNYHMDTHGWSDIGYSFLVGEDGNAYEGRGWDRIGAHTQGYNSVGLGFCMIGNFMNHVPNSAALNTVKALIACGVSMGKIQSSYTLRGHRDMGSTDCPGTALYNLIRTWPHY